MLVAILIILEYIESGIGRVSLFERKELVVLDTKTKYEKNAHRSTPGFYQFNRCPLPWDGFGSCTALMFSVQSILLHCRSLEWAGSVVFVALSLSSILCLFWFFLLRLAIVRNSGNLPNYPLSAFLSQISPKVYSYCSVLSLFVDGRDPAWYLGRKIQKKLVSPFLCLLACPSPVPFPPLFACPFPACLLVFLFLILSIVLFFLQPTTSNTSYCAPWAEQSEGKRGKGECARRLVTPIDRILVEYVKLLLNRRSAVVLILIRD